MLKLGLEMLKFKKKCLYHSSCGQIIKLGKFSREYISREFGIQYSPIFPRNSESKVINIVIRIFFQMSCFLYFVSCCVLCVLLMSNHRVKLKVRYSITFLALALLLFIYVLFPVCGKSIFQFEDLKTKTDKRSQTQLDQNKIVLIGGRELFDAAEKSSLNEKEKSFITIHLPDDTHYLNLKRDTFDAAIKSSLILTNERKVVQGRVLGFAMTLYTKSK